MSEPRSSDRAHRVYRVDRFTLPDSAREGFLTRVRQTHAVLRDQPGFLQDLVLEQPAEAGECHLLTLVEWESPAALQQARAAVSARQAAMGFNPQELIARLGIRADLGSYRPTAG